MLHTILVPLDGSLFGEAALAYAASIAERTGALVHLVHVHVADALPIENGDVLAYIKRDEELRLSEYDYLEDIGKRLLPLKTGRHVTVLPTGPVAETLCQYAEQHAVDLIVMATHGRGGVSRLWMGSVADRCVRQCQTPILLIRSHEYQPERTPEPGIRHLLIPLDGSSLAEQVIPHALALGSDATTYHLLHVITSPYGLTGSSMYEAAVSDQLVEQWLTAMQGYLDGVAHRMFPEHASIQKRVTTGFPVNTILQDIENNHIDVVALATHGRSGLARTVLGSVADKVLRGTNIAVLAYRPPVAEHTP